VWQIQDLETSVFGSVAVAGLTGEFLEVWQLKDLAETGLIQKELQARER